MSRAISASRSRTATTRRRQDMLLRCASYRRVSHPVHWASSASVSGLSAPIAFNALRSSVSLALTAFSGAGRESPEAVPACRTDRPALPPRHARSRWHLGRPFGRTSRPWRSRRTPVGRLGGGIAETATASDLRHIALAARLNAFAQRAQGEWTRLSARSVAQDGDILPEVVAHLLLALFPLDEPETVRAQKPGEAALAHLDASAAAVRMRRALAVETLHRQAVRFRNRVQ